VASIDRADARSIDARTGDLGLTAAEVQDRVAQ